MRKPLFAFLFMMLVSTSLPAQSIKRFWSDGPLTAKDFVSISDSTTSLSWYLGYTQVTEKKDAVVYTYYKAVAYMLPYSSYLSSEKDLDYCQTLFDLLEVHRRELQIELNEAGTTEELESLLEAARRRMMKDEQALSFNTSLIAGMQQRTHWAIEHTEASPFPLYTDQPFRFGVSAGNTVNAYIGEFSGTFSPSGGASVGAEMGWNRSMLLFGSHITFGKVLNSVYPFEANNYFMVMDFNLSYGLTVCDKRGLRITPYVGYAYDLFSSSIAIDDTIKSVWASGFGPQLGVIFDIPLYSILITQSRSSGIIAVLHSNHSIYGLRVRLYVQRLATRYMGEGFTINLDFGVSYLGRNTRPYRSL